jgi:hypothetical protein
MKKFLILAVLALLGLTFVDVVAAQGAAGGWRRRARVRYAPAPSVVVVQGQTGAGYRTYSYEPSTGYRTYSYQPAPTYRYSPSMRGPSRTPTGFGDATRKALGNY